MRNLRDRSKKNIRQVLSIGYDTQNGGQWIGTGVGTTYCDNA